MPCDLAAAFGSAWLVPQGYAGLLAKGEDARFQNKAHLGMEAAGFAEVKRVGEK